MQIQFTEAQSDRLRSEAAREGVSISAIVRAFVDDALAKGPHAPSREELLRRAAAVVGKYRSGLGDLAARHDDYLAEALEDS